MSKNHAALVLEVLGASAVTAGVALVSLAAALVVGGLLVLLFAIAWQLGVG